MASLTGGTSCQARDGGTLDVAVTDDMSTFDVNKEAIGPPVFKNAMSLVFDRLVRPTPDLKRLEPRLATSIEPNDDFTEWTIKLRPGVKFQDGSALDAKDVVFTLKYYLKGVNGFALGPVSAVKATGPLEVRVSFSAPYAQFETEALSSVAGSILPANFGGRSPDQYWRKPIGTGPYSVDSFRPGGDIVFKRFKGYWDKGKPHIDRIDLHLVRDPSARVLGLKSGEMGLADRLPADDVSDLGADATARAIRPSLITDALFLSSSVPMLRDVKVRRAISAALDRGKLVRGAYDGYATPASSSLPAGYPNVPPAPEDSAAHVGEAKQLLSQSNAPRGGALELLYVKGDPPIELEAQIVQQQLARIGLKLHLVPTGFAEAFDRVQKGQYQVFLYHSEAITTDAVDVLGFYVASKGYYGNWPTAPVQKMLGELTAAGDPAEQRKVLQRYVDYTGARDYQVPLSNPYWLNGQSKRLSGLNISPIDEWYLTNAWLCR